MILFPYAKDLEYSDRELAFVLQFFDNNRTTDIELKIGLDDDLSNLIEELLNSKEEV